MMNSASTNAHAMMLCATARTVAPLILWGADRLIPLEFGERFTREIRGSRLVVFDALGHVPHEEDPARTVVPVKAFLGVPP